MLAHLIQDVFKNAVLVSGLVVILMMMIESLNIESRGHLFASLSSGRISGVLLGAFLGVIPGCMGGFATVSLYSHRMLSFGALVAMMTASSGDEAFLMMAAFPDKVWWIFLILFGVAVLSGFAVDLFVKREPPLHCGKPCEVHSEDLAHSHSGRHPGWKRVVLIVGVAAFAAALAFGLLEHGEHEEAAIGFSLLSEDWMNVLFAVLCVGLLVVLVLAPDHFVDEHLWKHVISRHLPGIFAWSLGVLAFVGIFLNYVDISAWISDNTVLMILLAAAVGLIPESGPHMIFVTLYAAGVVPLPVLLASCISQDGHASLPLIAESKSGFLRAKAINFAVAVAVAFVSMLF